MFFGDRTNKQYALLALGLGVLVLVGIILLFVAVASSDSSAVTTTAETASDDSGFPWWLFGVMFPAVFVPIFAAKANQRNEEKAKNESDDPTFEKAKREDVHYQVGPDGELIEVFDEDADDYEDTR